MNNFYINQDNQSLYSQFINSTTDTVEKLTKELQSLSTNEMNELATYQPYIEANNQLNNLVQVELLNLIKRQLNANPDVINKVIESIKSFKNEKNKEIEDFQEYIKNYSDITYKEFKELKYANK